MTDNLTDKFIDSIYSLSRSKIPDSIMHQAKRCLLDYLGVTFAGARLMKEKGNKLLGFFGDIKDANTTVIGFNRKANVSNAIFVNGLSSHIAELDDGVRFSAIHVGAPTFSALLPVAEREKITWDKLLSGIVAGYEAASRIAFALKQSHYNLGYHPTGTCGAFGAVIGLSAMLSFSKKQMKDAFSAASVTSSGMLKVIEDGSELKPYNVAHAAHLGFYATLMAKAGFVGLDDVLSGSSGFLSMMSDDCDLSNFEKNDGLLEIEKVYFKPYASCRHTHPAIEAALKIKTNFKICSSEIKSIDVTTYQRVIGRHDHSDIRGASSAKMSIPYCVAVVLISGKAGLEQFSEEYTSNPEIIELTKKVLVKSDAGLSALVPSKRVAIVDLETINGEHYMERVEFPKGEPENPLSDEELKSKFVTLSVYGNKTLRESSEIVDIIFNADNNLKNLFCLL